MRRDGLLHPHLSAALTRLGHTDTVVLADRGLPIPTGIPDVVHLEVVAGVPDLATVLTAVLDEIVVDGAVVATQTPADSAWLARERERLGGVERVDHEQLKAMSAQARLFVRTGESRPFGNIVLRCGVPF